MIALALLRKLLSRDDKEVDSIIVATFITLFAFIAFQAWDLHKGNAFNPATFGVGSVGIIGAFGTAKRLRDGPANAPDPMAPPPA